MLAFVFHDCTSNTENRFKTFVTNVSVGPVKILLLVSAAFRSRKARHNSRTNKNWNSTFSFGLELTIININSNKLYITNLNNMEK